MGLERSESESRREPESAGRRAEAAPSAAPARRVTGSPQLLALQRSAGNALTARWLARQSADVERVAARGTAGAAGTLPHVDALRASFGRHDPGGIRAHRDPGAAAALAARAYVAGGEVVHGDGLDVWSAAHEAAHVFQQRAGRTTAGERALEREADAVADRVVAGGSAERVIDGWGPQRDVRAPAGVLRLPDEELQVGIWYLIWLDKVQVAAKLVDKNKEGCVFAPRGYAGHRIVSGDDVIMTMEAFEGREKSDAPKAPELSGQPPRIVEQPKGGAAAKPVVDADLDPQIGPELVAAYRRDLKTSSSAWLQEHEGSAVANVLGVTAHIAEQRDRELIVRYGITYGSGAVHGVLLHINGNHYIVLREVPRGDTDNYDFFDQDARCYRRYGVTVDNGDCLLDGLQMIADGTKKNASPERIAELRGIAEQGISDQDVTHALITFITEYVRGGSIMGVGPEVTAFIKSDGRAVAAHDAAKRQNEELAAKGKSASPASAFKRPESKPAKGSDAPRDDKSDQSDDEGELRVGRKVEVTVTDLDWKGTCQGTIKKMGAKQCEVTPNSRHEATALHFHRSAWFDIASVTPVKSEKPEGRPYVRSGEGDPSAAEVLPYAQHLSHLTELGLNNPLQFSWLSIAGGMHSVDEFKGFAASQDVEVEIPTSKKSGKEVRKAISATNSFSAFLSGFGGDVLGPIESWMHPAREGAEPLDLLPPAPDDLELPDAPSADSDDEVLSGPVSEESSEDDVSEAESEPPPNILDQAPKALTGFRHDYIRMQTTLPKSNRAKKLEGLGLVSAAQHPEGPEIAKGRGTLHTEAQWVHSQEYQNTLDEALERIQKVMSLFSDPATTAKQEKGSSAEELDPSEDPEIIALLTLLPQTTLDLVINRSSCTGKSGYAGGCAHEHADQVNAFWSYAEDVLGADGAGLVQMLKLIKFNVSFAGRDTNAGDNTVEALDEADVELGVIPKMDPQAKGAQNIDRNQFDALKLIAKSKQAKRAREWEELESEDEQPESGAKSSVQEEHPVDRAYKELLPKLDETLVLLHGQCVRTGNPAASFAKAVAALTARTLRAILMATHDAPQKKGQSAPPKKRQRTDEYEFPTQGVAAMPDAPDSGGLDDAVIEAMCAAIEQQVLEIFPTDPVSTGEHLMLFRCMGQAREILQAFCGDVYNLY